MKTTASYLPVLLMLFLFSCKTQQDIVEVYPMEFEEELLDTLVVTAPVYSEDEKIPNKLPEYRASATRKLDLIHTELSLSFDWSKQHVLGKAALTLRPYFYSTDIAVLDAKVFDIHKISLDGELLTYDYDGQKLNVHLGRIYNRDETFVLHIDYTAKPNEGPSGGSAAITSDKGLFFIDPLDENKNKPTQIWTQGETENSSRWFPTIDKPNERCTQEIYITVDNKYKTLSNGLLISSEDNGNGTRTDYWKQDKPHAPYLFMVGVGEYAVVEDKWRDIPLMYYVEPAYEKDAKRIFAHTAEMLEYFSGILGYDYPWDKYAQIVCKDYVSGAMENTGAVVFGEFVQKDSREFIDSNNDDIVAHELFHHWFGDLVTCESWSNLTLNEGFATYSEYLWRHHKYGHENAEKKRMLDMNGYLMSAGQSGAHDLIDFEYEDREHMFDGHSYNKGGLIVHMLRSYVGDDAFFAAVKKYLSDNQYSDVEAHELRLAFEEVVGEDLNWFFNQWFYDKGHPELSIEYNFENSAKVLVIEVEQTQDAEEFPAIFRLPAETAVYYASGRVDYFDLVLDQRKQIFEIELPSDEQAVVAVFDGKHNLLTISKEKRSEEDYVNLFKLSSEYGDKINAIKKLKGTPNMHRITDQALLSPAPEIRSQVINYLDKEEDKDKLRSLALSDESSLVRTSALKRLNELDLAKQQIETDSSFWVINECLSIISKQDIDEAVRYSDQLRKHYYKPLIGKLSEIYASTGEEKYLDFFEENIQEVSLFSFFNYISQYSRLAMSVQDNDRLVQTAKILQAEALDNSASYFKKYSSTNFIKSLSKELRSRQETDELQGSIEKLDGYISEIVNASTDNRLRATFREYIQP